MHLFDKPLRHAATANPRVGAYYAMGGMALAVVGLWLRPWGYALLWPAGSMVLLATGYFGLGAAIYRKRGGKLPASAWVLFWPVLLGQWVSLLFYARRSRAWDCLTPTVWIGRRLTECEAREAIEAGVTAVVDLAGELSENAEFRRLHYLDLPILDLTRPTMAQLQEAAAFIEHEAGGGVVYVHCKAGYSRTAAVAGAYLLASGQAEDVDAAEKLMRSARPGIIMRPEVIRAIQDCMAQGQD